MSEPDKAPACFAAASVFSHDSNVCRACQAFDACAQASLDTLEKIKGLVNVEDLLKRHAKARKASIEAARPAPEEKPQEKPPMAAERTTQVAKVSFDIDRDQNAALATITNAKGQEQFMRLCRAGLIETMRKDLAAGRNTFARSGPKHIKVCIDLLLHGGCTKGDFKGALMEREGWSEGTASSHVSMTWPGFVAFGLAQEIEGRLVLPPAVSA